MSLLVKWGRIFSYLIYTPAGALDFVFLFLRGTFRCRAMFLVEYLKITVDTNLQLYVVDLCNFWCTKPLGSKKKNKLRTFLNANKHAKCYILPTDGQVCDYHRSSHLW